METTFPHDQAALLASHARRVGLAARDLAVFTETDHDLLAECGFEVGALEVKMALFGGAPARIAAAAAEAAAAGRNVRIRSEDMDALSRLEGLLTLAGARMTMRIAAIDSEQSQTGLTQLGSIIGLASGAVGLIKSIF